MVGGEKRNRLDDLSYELGRNAEGLEGLKNSFDQHCRDDDRRHEENVKLLTANNDAIAGLQKTIAERLAMVSPDGSFLSKKQIAVLALLGTAVMVVVGWMVEAAFKWAFAWVIGSALKVKIGG